MAVELSPRVQLKCTFSLNDGMSTGVSHACPRPSIFLKEQRISDVFRTILCQFVGRELRGSKTPAPETEKAKLHWNVETLDNSIRNASEGACIAVLFSEKWFIASYRIRKLAMPSFKLSASTGSGCFDKFTDTSCTSICVTSRPPSCPTKHSQQSRMHFRRGKERFRWSVDRSAMTVWLQFCLSQNR